ncbi:unnamed protein product, partial [Polarella glacialis]
SPLMELGSRRPRLWNLFRAVQITGGIELVGMTLHALAVSELKVATRPKTLVESLDISGCIAAIVRISLSPMLQYLSIPLVSQDPNWDGLDSFWQAFAGMLAASLPFALLYLLSFATLAVRWSILGTAPESVVILTAPLLPALSNLFLSDRMHKEISRLE